MTETSTAASLRKVGVVENVKGDIQQSSSSERYICSILLFSIRLTTLTECKQHQSWCMHGNVNGYRNARFSMMGFHCDIWSVTTGFSVAVNLAEGLYVTRRAHPHCWGKWKYIPAFISGKKIIRKYNRLFLVLMLTSLKISLKFIYSF